MPGFGQADEAKKAPATPAAKATAKQKPAVPMRDAKAPTMPTPEAGGQAAAKQTPIYIIGPGDRLEVVVWREQDLTRRGVLVRPDGRISMPLIDDIMAAGLTPMQLKYRLTKVLSHFIEAPQVYVILDKVVYDEVSVLGNVVRPGNYVMEKPTDVLQGLAMAGGFNEWADKDSVTILRGIGPNRKILPFIYKEVVEGEKLIQNVILKPGDIIIVP
ncbi:MAG: polysaccharide biosynthesis/export family protein [Thermodesulfobacteriota bacterium]